MSISRLTVLDPFEISGAAAVVETRVARVGGLGSPNAAAPPGIVASALPTRRMMQALTTFNGIAVPFFVSIGTDEGVAERAASLTVAIISSVANGTSPLNAALRSVAAHVPTEVAR